MKKEINFGIGFITGRANICNIINTYYKYIIDQVKELDFKINFTFYILYDLKYLNTKEDDFYRIKKEVYKYIKIKYLSPKSVLNKKKEVMEKHNLTEDEADFIIGKGYAKSRNTILYEALEENIDYLLFWDDDEYPLAAIEDEKNIKWMKQKNVLQHIRNIKNADVTYGYRCGMVNPLPVMNYNDIITEEIYHRFIDALENEVVRWDIIQGMQKKDLGIKMANRDIATYKAPSLKMKNIGKTEFVLGSGICLNLTHLERIPAFYNPPDARGEDTFFSCALLDTGAKVLRIPVYHFHDAFLKFTFLMKDKFPKRIKKITTEDNSISYRFKRTTTGWIKYKPLLYYILERDSYRDIINKAKSDLNESVTKMSTAFPDCDLTVLTGILEKYDKDVEIHYNEYIETQNIWNRIKFSI